MSFSPAIAGRDTEITLSFVHNARITAGETIKVFVSGFTAGNRDNRKARDIYRLAHWASSDYGIRDETVDGMADDTSWRAMWVEGQVANEFRDSYIMLFALEPVDMFEPFTIVIDRSNGIKPLCGIPADWSMFRVQSPDNPAVVRMNETSAISVLRRPHARVLTGRRARTRRSSCASAERSSARSRSKLNLPGFSRRAACAVALRAHRRCRRRHRRDGEDKGFSTEAAAPSSAG